MKVWQNVDASFKVREGAWGTIELVIEVGGHRVESDGVSASLLSKLLAVGAFTPEFAADAKMALDNNQAYEPTREKLRREETRK